MTYRDIPAGAALGYAFAYARWIALTGRSTCGIGDLGTYFIAWDDLQWVAGQSVETQEVQP